MESGVYTGVAGRDTRVPFGKLRRLDVGIAKRAYRGHELVRSWLGHGRGLRVLFSTMPDWEPQLASAFALTPYAVQFGELTPASIAAHDLVVPLSLRALDDLQQMRDLVAGNPIPIPSSDSIRICDDKYLFNEALISHGFGELIPRMYGDPGYPFILKKKQGEWSRNVHLIRDDAQRRQYAAELASPEYFHQEFVRGPYEYATHILFRRGRVACSIEIEYAFGTATPTKGLDRELYKRVRRCPWLAQFSAVLASIGFEGLCCVNYKERDGRPLILEINPRFGGSLCPYFFIFLRHLH